MARTRTAKPDDASTGPAQVTSPDAGARRSRRLRQDDVEMGELPKPKRPRKSQENVEQESEDQDEAGGEDTATRENNSTRRRAGSNLRVHTLRKVAEDTHRRKQRASETNQTTKRVSRRSFALEKRRVPPRQEESPEPELQHQEDIYDVPVSPPRGSQPRPRASQDESEETRSNPEDELFVPQEEASDADLYEEPTRVGNGHEEEISEETPEEAEEQPSPSIQKLRDIVVDLGPAAPDAEPTDFTYPDDHYIFAMPAGDEKTASAPYKTHTLKYMTELMSGSGWARGINPHVAGSLPKSKVSREFWDDFVFLKSFWSSMPRAPYFDEQCDYLHNDDLASRAKKAIKRIDSFVSMTVERAKKTSNGFEELMPPKPLTKDLYEKMIPVLIATLNSVFQRGVAGKQQWLGTFTKSTLQIMQRLLAWIHRLYVTMMDSLAKRPRDQTGTQRKSREKLSRYLVDLKVEFKNLDAELTAAPWRKRAHEERVRRALEAQERQRVQEEERRRWQRELVDRQIAERFAHRATAAQETQAAQQTSTARQNQGLQPATTPQGTSQQAGDDDDSWSFEADRHLLKILLNNPKVQPQFLAWELDRSIDDVRDRVEVLKQAARTNAANKGTPLPAFAAT
ncbi:hypothetical protein GCG54_00002603 [Colletotrichum gloeosporioides]|uniref:Uncharacterized protein n=1 Tax=Colletotrichum gloeosporioides TaxID=474922 RepID=A0A8H4CUM2_COLGL|nr:uncharacterized protein GCG54_00002603 [Colletotrichum gloeosporioides]KAF3810151.1 hypothetical protein GCG54_00002603 [Colletotrichum gloeosporioides]